MIISYEVAIINRNRNSKEEGHLKKLVCIVLTLVMILSVASAAMAEAKVAILTGTVSQGEEEYRAAQAAIAKYGADKVITDTYPDSFMAEQETTISKLLAFAADPDVKAIVMCQAVPGAKAAFDKIREMGRDDILLIAGVPQEDPAVITAASDLILYADEASQGDTIMETLDKWGCEILIHYSFPRHMAMELIAARHNVLQANADALGIALIERTAPDPTNEAGGGIPAAQQFILEDVPKVMEEYAGKKIAFFSTNCAMQEPLQTAVLAAGANAFYPQPCCASPYHAFPASMGLGLSQSEAMDKFDEVSMLKTIAAKLAETDSVGRFSTWPMAVNMGIIAVACEYAWGYINGDITSRNDKDALLAEFDKTLGGATIGNYTDANGTVYDNYYTILLEPVDFNDYLDK